MKQLLMLLLTSLFLAGCQTANERARAAGERIGDAAAASAFPDLPNDCRRQERSGVRLGEPLDLALIRTDQALGRANARVRRCAKWHDAFKAGLNGEGEQ
ncbi:hypothetical protein LP7551_02051 [Roseibium album]|nr:hypothetical protein LP7551_02051 [Roseibium album]